MDQAISLNMHPLEIGEYSHNSSISVGKLKSLALLSYKRPLSNPEPNFLVRHFISVAFALTGNFY